MKLVERRNRLLCAALLCAALLCALLWLAPYAARADEVPDLSQIELDVEKGINAHRKATGRPAFRSDATVAKIARGHSKDMARGKVRFGHDGLRKRIDQVQKHMVIAGAAENVSKHQRGSDQAEVAVAKWLKSPVHLTNIDGDYDLSGVGAASSSDGTVYITQIFVKLRKE